MNKRNFFKNLGLGFTSILNLKLEKSEEKAIKESPKQILNSRTINLTLRDGKSLYSAAYVIGDDFKIIKKIEHE